MGSSFENRLVIYIIRVLKYYNKTGTKQISVKIKIEVAYRYIIGLISCRLRKLYRIEMFF